MPDDSIPSNAPNLVAFYTTPQYCLQIIQVHAEFVQWQDKPGGLVVAGTMARLASHWADILLPKAKVLKVDLGAFRLWRTGIVDASSLDGGMGERAWQAFRTVDQLWPRVEAELERLKDAAILEAMGQTDDAAGSRTDRNSSPQADSPPIAYVPVKTAYPSPPPANLPRWLHLDWIQTTAAGLMQWHALKQRQQNIFRTMEMQGRKFIDDADPGERFVQDECNRLWQEIVPLFDEVRTYFPLKVWRKLKHIRTPHDADSEPENAVKEWQLVRDYGLDRHAKLLRRIERRSASRRTSVDATGPAPERADAERTKPAQNKFADKYLKEAREMATTFVGKLQPPPANPQAMIYDLVCHTLGALIWTFQQTQSDMQRGYCKLSDREEFVEIEQAHFDTIICQHHPEYQGEPLPLTQSRADILMKEIAWRINEVLGPLDTIKSDGARENLHAEIARFTKQTIARYTVEPFGTNEVVKEMAALQQLILRWIDRWELPISPQNIAFHVHWAFKDYGETIRDSGGPLPPTAGAMRPAEGVHYLESLIRRLEELGKQEYFNPDRDIPRNGAGRENDKAGQKATATGEAHPGEGKGNGKRIHSDDFTFVNWEGTEYLFNPGQQAQAIKHLWEAFEKGGLGLAERTVGELIGSNSDDYRLAHTFRSKSKVNGRRRPVITPHAAWGTMIQKAGPGMYRLAKSKSR